MHFRKQTTPTIRCIQAPADPRSVKAASALPRGEEDGCEMWWRGWRESITALLRGWHRSINSNRRVEAQTQAAA